MDGGKEREREGRKEGRKEDGFSVEVGGCCVYSTTGEVASPRDRFPFSRFCQKRRTGFGCKIYSGLCRLLLKNPTFPPKNPTLGLVPPRLSRPTVSPARHSHRRRAENVEDTTEASVRRKYSSVRTVTTWRNETEPRRERFCCAGCTTTRTRRRRRGRQIRRRSPVRERYDSVSPKGGLWTPRTQRLSQPRQHETVRVRHVYVYVVAERRVDFEVSVCENGHSPIFTNGHNHL